MLRHLPSARIVHAAAVSPGLSTTAKNHVTLTCVVSSTQRYGSWKTRHSEISHFAADAQYFFAAVRQVARLLNEAAVSRHHICSYRSLAYVCSGT